MSTEAAPASSWPERLAVPVTGITAGAFGLLAALRRNRVFHPVGEAFEGALRLHPEATEVLPTELTGSLEVTVRFSRGAGVPEPLPDVLGVAIKMPLQGGTEQDLLLASSGAPVGLRNLLIPARSFFAPAYSSILPYRVRGGTQVVFGARADASQAGRRGDFGDLSAAAAAAALRFDLLVAELSGPWRTIGSLEVTRRLPQETSRALRFNPWNTHADLQPAGPLNTLRKRAYQASQAIRPD